MSTAAIDKPHSLGEHKVLEPKHDPSSQVRVSFYRELLRLWEAGRPPASATFADYLRRLAVLSRGLTEVEASANDLSLFREIAMRRPNHLRYRLLGANVERLRSLGDHERAMLGALEVSPDLLSPLGNLRYEPAHTRLLGYFMDPRRCPSLSVPLLGAFLTEVGMTEDVLESESLQAARIANEFEVLKGRVDVCIDTPRCLAFVEVKIDAVEGRAQLPRYRTALDLEAGHRSAALVFLTLPGAEGPSLDASCIHLSLDRVLKAWLPFAGVGSSPAGYLSRYLASLARLLGYAGDGPFEKWSFAVQRNALELVDSKENA